MWITDMVRSAKCQLRDVFGIIPTGGTEDDPTFTNADGIYLMDFDDLSNYVVVAEGRFFFNLKIMKPSEKPKGR